MSCQGERERCGPLWWPLRRRHPHQASPHEARMPAALSAQPVLSSSLPGHGETSPSCLAWGLPPQAFPDSSHTSSHVALRVVFPLCHHVRFRPGTG